VVLIDESQLMNGRIVDARVRGVRLIVEVVDDLRRVAVDRLSRVSVASALRFGGSAHGVDCDAS